MDEALPWMVLTGFLMGALIVLTVAFAQAWRARPEARGDAIAGALLEQWPAVRKSAVVPAFFVSVELDDGGKGLVRIQDRPDWLAEDMAVTARAALLNGPLRARPRASPPALPPPVPAPPLPDFELAEAQP